MTRHATRFALFDPDGEPILSAVGIWTAREMVETYAGCVYGHDGTWEACAAEGYTIRLVDITEAATPGSADVAFLRAARRCLTEPAAGLDVVRMAADVVQKIDRDPVMLALAAGVLRATKGAAA